MPSRRSLRRPALALLLVTAAACAPRADLEPEPQGQEFVIEIVNTMPHAMNVRYELGTANATLGTVEPGQTRRFTLTNRGSDELRLVASDQGNTHTVEGRVDLEGGDVRRWEIK